MWKPGKYKIWAIASNDTKVGARIILTPRNVLSLVFQGPSYLGTFELTESYDLLKIKFDFKRKEGRHSATESPHISGFRITGPMFGEEEKMLAYRINHGIEDNRNIYHVFRDGSLGIQQLAKVKEQN